MKTQTKVSKITLYPQGDKTEVDRVYKYLRDGMEVQARMMNMCISAMYSAKMHDANKDEMRELRHLYSHVPGSKKGSAYDFDMSMYPVGLPIAGSIPRFCDQKLSAAMKHGLKHGNMSLPTFRKNAPLNVHNDFINVRGSKTRSSGQIIDTGFYHDYNSPGELVEALEKDKQPKIHIKFANNITFDVVFGNAKNSAELRKTIERVFSGEYKVCDSSIGINKKGKIILNLTMDIPVKENYLDENIVVGVDPGMAKPVTCALNNDAYTCEYIGSYEEFTGKRVRIQKRIRSLQKSLKYSKGGHGREKKLKAINTLREREKRLVETQNHIISRGVVNFTKKNRGKYINMEDLTGIARDDSESSKFINRNWSYYQLQQMIEYKAEAEGIVVRYVDPAYTSQTCSVCGERGIRSTQASFVCTNPDCKSHKMYKRGMNADFNAARNIAMSKNFIEKGEKKQKRKITTEKTA